MVWKPSHRDVPSAIGRDLMRKVQPIECWNVRSCAIQARKNRRYENIVVRHLLHFSQAMCQRKKCLSCGASRGREILFRDTRCLDHDVCCFSKPAQQFITRGPQDPGTGPGPETAILTSKFSSPTSPGLLTPTSIGNRPEHPLAENSSENPWIAHH